MEKPEENQQQSGSGLDALACSRLFELCDSMISILETVEESDSGRAFYPTQITGCRTHDLERIGDIITEIKSICENAEAQTPAPESE